MNIPLGKQNAERASGARWEAEPLRFSLVSFGKLSTTSIEFKYIALRACAKGGMTSRALAMFQMMKDMRLALDVHAYTSIMDVCAKAAMWKQSLNLLDEMRSKGIAPKPTNAENKNIDK